jgi:2'-5' RNA ligase
MFVIVCLPCSPGTDIIVCGGEPAHTGRVKRVVRTFIAVELPADIRESIRVCQSELARSRARLTMVDPGIVHITIKFLGEIDEQRIGAVSDALSGIRLDPFEIEVGMPVLNTPRRPRIVWCGISDQGGCGCLHMKCEEVLSGIGLPRDNRPFSPHATIARIRDFDPSLAKVISILPRAPFGRCRVDRFSLKKSTLTPRGPVYETISEVRW